ncbi:MAG TPA: methyltransferase domain-containing protein [Alphaproteobacteria bacterium]|nr:methyltransferase domain-containing protein [Alphaproteobacteria bacterium]
MAGSPRVFDRRVVRLHLARAARVFADHDFLFREAAGRLAERLDDVRRTFPVALAHGGHGGVLVDALADRSDIATLVESDLSPEVARRACARSRIRRIVVADEEFLPFGEASFDLVLSCLSLHWTNDLPGALVQIRRALKPDGLFIAALLGGETLKELRQALIEAEAAASGGVSPRVSPFLDVREAGALLQRAGFALPVVDADTWTVTYSSAVDLMRDLRGMGETNAVFERPRHFTRRTTLLRAAAIYQSMFADKSERIPATFQVIMLTGWAPHASQPRPLKPGSAVERLAAALDTREHSAGEAARPRSDNEP